MNKYVVGKCNQMCPEDEIDMRERERLLHVLEMVTGTEKTRHPKADREKMVKCYSRSAAGKSMENTKNLRPAEVLLKTINYLLSDVTEKTDMNWIIIYDFISDRLRAVRQDMIIQNLPKSCWITMLQPMIRFHAFAAYKLCEEVIDVYDPVINGTHLQECLKRLLSVYDEVDLSQSQQEKHSQYLCENRPYFEAMYLLFNLGNLEAITRAILLQTKFRTWVVNLALEASLSYIKNNFVRVCRTFSKLPPLLAMVASLQLPRIRKKSLQLMSVAYNSRTLMFPIATLKDWLLYNTTADVIKDCKYYGLEVCDNQVTFLKNTFNIGNSVPQPTHSNFVEDKLVGVSISELLLYSKCKENVYK